MYIIIKGLRTEPCGKAYFKEIGVDWWTSAVGGQ